MGGNAIPVEPLYACAQDSLVLSPPFLPSLEATLMPARRLLGLGNSRPYKAMYKSGL